MFNIALPVVALQQTKPLILPGTSASPTKAKAIQHLNLQLQQVMLMILTAHFMCAIMLRHVLAGSIGDAVHTASWLTHQAHT